MRLWRSYIAFRAVIFALCASDIVIADSDIATVSQLWKIPYAPAAGLPRYALNDERVGHPHSIGIAVPGDSFVASLL